MCVPPLQLAQLRQADDVWNTLGVLNYLQALVGKSGIVEELTASGATCGQTCTALNVGTNSHILACAPVHPRKLTRGRAGTHTPKVSHLLNVGGRLRVPPLDASSGRSQRARTDAQTHMSNCHLLALQAALRG